MPGAIGPISSMMLRATLGSSRCCRTTPLGRPVVPEVSEIQAGFAAPGRSTARVSLMSVDQPS